MWQPGPMLPIWWLPEVLQLEEAIKVMREGGEKAIWGNIGRQWEGGLSEKEGGERGGDLWRTGLEKEGKIVRGREREKEKGRG